MSRNDAKTDLLRRESRLEEDRRRREAKRAQRPHDRQQRHRRVGETFAAN